MLEIRISALALQPQRPDGEHRDQSPNVAPGADRTRPTRRACANISLTIRIPTCPKRLAAVKWKSGAMCAASISAAFLSGKAEKQAQAELGNASDRKSA